MPPLITLYQVTQPRLRAIVYMLVIHVYYYRYQLSTSLSKYFLPRPTAGRRAAALLAAQRSLVDELPQLGHWAPFVLPSDGVDPHLVSLSTTT